MTNASQTTDRHSRSAVRAAEGILSTLDDGAWRIQIHRASKRNALTMTMFSALAESLGLAQSNDAVRAITLSGLGPNFCAGHDLSAFDSWPQGAGDPVPRFLHALADVRKPLLIGVHGSAAGIGVTMLLMPPPSRCWAMLSRASRTCFTGATRRSSCCAQWPSE